MCVCQVSGLYRAAEGIAMIDLLYSFATSVTLANSDQPFVRPTVTFIKTMYSDSCFRRY
jgi:hypothetical protein